MGGARRSVPLANRCSLEDGVNERRQGGPLCQDDQKAQQKQNDEDRAEPPFFPVLHEVPDFAENR